MWYYYFKDNKKLVLEHRDIVADHHLFKVTIMSTETAM
jgi:hypothetical protein